MITSLKQIDFKDSDCPFDALCCFEYNGAVYEEFDDSWPTQFRIVLDQDDYDYVEDATLIAELTDFLL